MDYLIENGQFISKIGQIWAKIVVFDQIRWIFDIIKLFRYKFEVKFEIRVRIWIEIVATIDRTTGIESQKSIKSRFKYNLDRISGQPRLDRMSLQNTIEDVVIKTH